MSKKLILVTRHEKLVGSMIEMLEGNGYSVSHIPTIEVRSAGNVELLKKQFTRLKKFTDIVFVSRNAVKFGMAWARRYGGIPKRVRVLAVGESTASSLKKYELDVLYPSSGTGSEALMSVDELQSLEGRKVLIIRAVEGREWLAETMRERGAQVQYAECYGRFIPDESYTLFNKLMREGNEVHGIFFHSVGSAINLQRIAEPKDDVLMDAAAVVGSERIAEFLKEHKWRGPIGVAETPSNKDMMICLAEVLPDQHLKKL